VGVSNSTLNGMTRPFDIVTTACGKVRVALIGLLSDEPGIFRDGTFRGLQIGDVTTNTTDLYKALVEDRSNDQENADWILPLTHQTLERDKELAHSIMESQPGKSLILGGHEHIPYDVTVTGASEESVRILKAGCDAEGVNVVDLVFKEGVYPARLDKMEVQFVSLDQFEPSTIVQSIIDSHMALLTAMENEDVLHAESLLPPGFPLSSEGTRLKQTTVGGLLCMCIKEELETDVAILNGASIKGNMTYEPPNMTYAQLKKELPFPTKIVVVTMTRRELQDAIHYSRTENPPRSKDGTLVERKGYLQVDIDFERTDVYMGRPDDELSVALPRNLLSGFCEIEPLITVGQRLKEAGIFPKEDDFVPAMDLVVRHSSKERWFEMFHTYSFHDLDTNKKGYLTREDITRILREAVGHEPSSFLVDDMISVVDADANGVIDAGEFSHLLAIMEREHNLSPFKR